MKRQIYATQFHATPLLLLQEQGQMGLLEYFLSIIENELGSGN